ESAVALVLATRVVASIGGTFSVADAGSLAAAVAIAATAAARRRERGTREMSDRQQCHAQGHCGRDQRNHGRPRGQTHRLTYKSKELGKNNTMYSNQRLI